MLKSLRDLLKRITTVDDRLELSSGRKLRDESHLLRVVNCHTTPHFLSPDDGGPEAPCRIRQTHDAGKVNAQVFAAVEGGRAHDVKYQVVGYCYGYGVQDAMERHREGTARVIPIILRPRCGTTPPFGKLLALPRDGKSVTTWATQDEGASLISSSASGSRLSGCPHQPTPMMVVGATGAEPAWAAEPVNAPRAGAKWRRKIIKAIHRVTREGTVASPAVGL